jgi:hypothetical protein
MSTRPLPSLSESASFPELGGETTQLHNLLNELPDPGQKKLCIRTTEEYEYTKKAYLKLSKHHVDKKQDPSYPWSDEEKQARVKQFLEAVAESCIATASTSESGPSTQRLSHKKKAKEVRLENMTDFEFNIMAWDLLVRGSGPDLCQLTNHNNRKTLGRARRETRMFIGGPAH